MVNEEHMTEILLFLVIISEVVVKVQDMEKIVVKKDETAELTEEEKAEEYVIESTMTEFECLMAQLNQSKLMQRALLYMIHQIPFTSQSTKSRVFQVFQTYP